MFERGAWEKRARCLAVAIKTDRSSNPATNQEPREHLLAISTSNAQQREQPKSGCHPRSCSSARTERRSGRAPNQKPPAGLKVAGFVPRAPSRPALKAFPAPSKGSVPHLHKSRAFLSYIISVPKYLGATELVVSLYDLHSSSGEDVKVQRRRLPGEGCVSGQEAQSSEIRLASSPGVQQSSNGIQGRACGCSPRMYKERREHRGRDSRARSSRGPYMLEAGIDVGAELHKTKAKKRLPKKMSAASK